MKDLVKGKTLGGRAGEAEEAALMLWERMAWRSVLRAAALANGFGDECAAGDAAVLGDDDGRGWRVGGTGLSGADTDPMGADTDTSLLLLGVPVGVDADLEAGEPASAQTAEVVEMEQG